MTIFRSTKRSLFFSALALFTCIIMLLGATYAWFYDSAINKDNQINTGNLNVELYQWTADDTSADISDSTTPLFSKDIIWEPNKTEVVYLSVKNAGTLYLKYKLQLEVTSVTEDNLADVMEYDVIAGTEADPYGYVTAWDENGGAKFEHAPGVNDTDFVDIKLAPGESSYFAISIHMLADASNTYMGEKISFNINVLAGQASDPTESDSITPDGSYDAFAGYPGAGFAPVPSDGVSAVEIPIRDAQGTKIGSAVVPSDAIADDATQVGVGITNSTYEGNFTVANGMETTAFEVKVDGLKADNDVPVKVALRIDAGLDPATVKLYHYDTEIACTYNPHTGYVTFESATFSPFTVVYDAESEYVATEVPKDEESGEVLYPTANVTYESQYVNTDLPWGSYGAWSPTEGFDSTLEAAFLFACPAELDPDFANWFCDFYVSLDQDLGANEIFLGGNYGSFGWVGFHNGDLTLGANEEIPLLGSVTSNPWTYADVYNSVGEFICGVGDVDDALNDATFTVKLRLTNPEDEAEFYDVNVVTYTFGGDYTIK